VKRIPFESLTKRQVFRALLWLAWDRGEMVYAGRLKDVCVKS